MTKKDKIISYSLFWVILIGFFTYGITYLIKYFGG